MTIGIRRSADRAFLEVPSSRSSPRRRSLRRHHRSSVQGRLTSAATLAMLSVAMFGVPETTSGQTLDRIRDAVRSPDESDRPADADRRSSESDRESRRRANRSNALVGSFDDASETGSSDDPSGNAAWDLTYPFGRMSFALAQGIFVGDPFRPGLDGSSEPPSGGDRAAASDGRSIDSLRYETDGLPSDSSDDEAGGFGDPIARFGRYPYADDRAGGMFEAFPGTDGGRSTRATLAFVSGSDFDDLQWLTGDLMVERAASRLGFGGSLTQVFESVPNGGTDELRIGEVHLLWRRLQTDRFQWRWGVGAVIVDDDEGTNGGIAGTARFDWFVRSPWIVSGEYDLGRAGSATYEHLRLTTGIAWKQLELAGGYDWRSFDGVDFSGPTVGLTLRW